MPAFHVHPSVLLLLGGIALAYGLAWREHAAGTSVGFDPQRRRKITFFSLGILVLVVGATWPIHDLAESRLYSVHMIQHMLFTLVGAPLLLAGTPDWMARALLKPKPIMRAMRVLTKPFVAYVFYTTVLVFTHWPAIVNGTVGSEWTHFGMHVLIFASAIIMWWPILSPMPELPAASRPIQMVYLFLLSLMPTVPASFLTFGESPLYKIYETFPRMGISALDDQRMAGLIMKLGGGFLLWGFITAIFFAWYKEETQLDGWDALKLGHVDREVSTGATK